VTQTVVDRSRRQRWAGRRGREQRWRRRWVDRTRRRPDEQRSGTVRQRRPDDDALHRRLVYTKHTTVTQTSHGTIIWSICYNINIDKQTTTSLMRAYEAQWRSGSGPRGSHPGPAAILLGSNLRQVAYSHCLPSLLSSKKLGYKREYSVRTGPI